MLPGEAQSCIMDREKTFLTSQAVKERAGDLCYQTGKILLIILPYGKIKLAHLIWSIGKADNCFVPYVGDYNYTVGLSYKYALFFPWL